MTRLKSVPRGVIRLARFDRIGRDGRPRPRRQGAPAGKYLGSAYNELTQRTSLYTRPRWLTALRLCPGPRNALKVENERVETASGDFRGGFLHCGYAFGRNDVN